jgi:hypothetical protein
MVVQLATVKQERNAAILKVIEKGGVLKRLSNFGVILLSFSSSRAVHDSQSLLVLQRSRPSWSSPGHLKSKTCPP